MPTGPTTTGSLTDSLPYVIAGARIVREEKGIYQRTTDAQTLSEGDGLDWNEIALAQLAAQAITETTTLNNPQQIQDTVFSVTPRVSGIHMKITDRTQRRISKAVWAKTGGLAQNAMQRKKDEDYLAMFATFTTNLGGTGAPLQSGHIASAVARITGNTTETSDDVINTILHGFQVKDLRDEIVAGVGTYAIPAGMTADVFRKGFAGMVEGSNVWTDGNITINGTPDARGATHAKEAVVLVQGHSLKRETRRAPDYGGGADELFIYDEYQLGERSAGNWAYSHLTDATVPTS